MARPIDQLITVITNSNQLTPVEKSVLVERISRPPSADEISRARDATYPGDNGNAWVNS